MGLTALLYAPVRALDPYRHLIRYALIAYTALTIVMWVAFGTRGTIGYVNKVNELILISLLVVEALRSRR